MNRAAAIIATLPDSIRVVVKTSRDLFDRFREALVRPIELLEGVFDCGAIHPPGESSRVDRIATLETYRRVHAAAESRLNREVTFLQEGGFAAVVSDIAPLPLHAARLAGVPGILVANFSWHDIFRHFIPPSGFRPASQRWGQRSSERCSDRRSEATGSCHEMLNQMRREYECATLVLRAQPAIASESSVPVRDVGLVAGRGRRRGRELRRALRLERSSRLVYVYVGRYGQADMEWQNLRRLDGFEFISYHGVPEQSARWHIVDPREWPPSDVAASVDVMVAKAGYGTVTDAMVNRTPLIFPPRHDFAEHRVLASGLRRWGGGIAVRTRDFKALRLRPAIERSLANEPGESPWPTDGASRAAGAILRIANGQSARLK